MALSGTAAAAKAAFERFGLHHSYVFISPPRDPERMLEYAKEAKAAAREMCIICCEVIALKQTAGEVCVQRWSECDQKNKRV